MAYNSATNLEFKTEELVIDRPFVDSLLENTISQKGVDSVKIIHIDGRNVAVYGEGNVSVKTFHFKTKHVIFFFVVSVVFIIGLILFIRKRKKEKAKKTSRTQSLTERELIVSQLVISGKQNKEIAEELFVSLSTVKTHINNIYKKLGIASRKELKKYNFDKSVIQNKGTTQ